jgi:hypothetical protein
MRVTFTGILEPTPQGGALVALPPHVIDALGGTRVRVTGSFAGLDFNSSTMPTGGGRAALGVHKATCEEAGVRFGEEVEIVVERDDRERPVEIPPALKRALDADPEARQAFERLAPTHQREYARWVAEAKREETAQRRVEGTLARLRESSG